MLLRREALGGRRDGRGGLLLGVAGILFVVLAGRCGRVLRAGDLVGGSWGRIRSGFVVLRCSLLGGRCLLTRNLRLCFDTAFDLCLRLMTG